MKRILLPCALLGLFVFACGGEIEPDTTVIDPDDDESLAEARARGGSPLPEGEFCIGGTTRECSVDGLPGMARCLPGPRWSSCAEIGDCRPDQSPPYCPGNSYTQRCARKKGVWVLDASECPPPNDLSSSTPLVLSFERAPVRFTHPNGSFDLVGREQSVETDWVSAATPWLAIDRDGNGRIDDGSELFGSMTRLPDGRRAEHGFAALASLDENADGRINAADSGFASLLLWRDENQDRRSQRDELSSVTEAGIVAIELGFQRDRRCVGTACEVERATFEFARGSEQRVLQGAVVDVHFMH